MGVKYLSQPSRTVSSTPFRHYPATIARSLSLAGVVFILLAVNGRAAPGAETPKARPALSSEIWPTFQHNRGHTGQSQFDTHANPGLEKWEFTLQEDGAESFSSPVIGPNGTIYVASDNLDALNPDGTLKWKSTVNVDSAAPALAADGTIYAVGTADPDYTNYLFAMTTNGRVKWKFATDDSSSAPVVGADGTIYFGCASFTYPEVGCLYAVKPNGQLKWKTTIGIAATIPAIDRQGSIYVGSADHNLYAFDINGKLRWKFATNGEVHSAPVIVPDGTIYCGSDDHYLYALNPDGTLRWKFRAGDGIDSGPAIGANGTIYVGSWDGYLYALTLSGKLKWEFATGNDVVASPAIGADGTIYVGSTSWYGELYAVSPRGNLLWSFPTKGPILKSSAIGADGTVYVTSYIDFYEHGLMTTIYAIGVGGHPSTLTLTDQASKRSPESVAPSNGSLVSTRGWHLYRNPALGLSFRYPPSMKVVEQRMAKTDSDRLDHPHLIAKIRLDSTGGEKYLLNFRLSDYDTSDQIASAYRSSHDGDCGYATHLPIGHQQAIACAVCIGADGCGWSVFLYGPRQQCQIELGRDVHVKFEAPIAPVQDGDYMNSRHDGYEFLPLLSIIKTVRCGPPMNK